ncbi:VOC family protein [Streptomyces sp. NPDC052236]|uniref:VOC family protein n=1 Tax=Streptomyces sp. NPDC052236 TaxID=3365686 RepID=UPI0037D97DC0
MTDASLDTPPRELPEVRPSPSGLTLHHIAVQTGDLAASIDWYQAFFGAEIAWTLDTYSDLSMERLPGLSGLAELTAGGLRFHVFTRGAEHGRQPSADTNQFQHICIEVRTSEELRAWQARWHSVRQSGAYTFVRDEPATDVVVDSDGVESFYAFDINGVEFEFTCLPGERA